MGNLPLGVPMRFDSEALLWEVADVYSQPECDRLIEFIEQSSPQLATNNSTFRNPDRVIKDDPQIAGDLFSRLQPHLPKQIENFRLIGLNERLRLYRYRPGQSFSAHMDHWYQPNDTQITLLTILLYLNSDFVGGETKFMEQLEASITPQTGAVAIFQHKIRHEGAKVIRGTKYLLRTDVIYEIHQ